jgi:hypothetical protein
MHVNQNPSAIVQKIHKHDKKLKYLNNIFTRNGLNFNKLHAVRYKYIFYIKFQIYGIDLKRSNNMQLYHFKVWRSYLLVKESKIFCGRFTSQ